MSGHPPTNFRWISPRKLAGSGRLSQAENVDWLAAEGIRAVVSTIPLWEDVMQSIRTHGIEHLPLHVEDFGVPTDEQIERFIGFVDAHLARGAPVLVHCAYGVGRTGTLASLWLVHTGMPAQDALDRVGVESRVQVELIKRWEERRYEVEDR